MAHTTQADRLAYLFEEDPHSSLTSASGTTGLSPADAIKQAICALQAFQTTKNTVYVDEAVELAQHAADCTPSGDDNLAGYLTALGVMHQHHYKVFGVKSSLDGAVAAARSAVEISSDDDDDQDLYIQNLAAALRYRYSESGDKKDLSEAISTMKHIFDSMDAGKPRLQALKSLLGLQKLSFEKTSDLRHLDEAIFTTSLLLDQVEGSTRLELLYNLCDLYDMRLDQYQTVENLGDCIGVCRDLLEAIPIEDGRRPGIMHNISVYYTRRCLQDSSVEDLKQAIEFNQMAVRSTKIELVERRTSLLEGLAQRFMLWYERAREFPTLDESILDRHIEGDKTNSQDLPEKATWLFMLSQHLEEKAEGMEPSNDALDNLELSMVLVYEALEATRDHHPNWEDMVNALRKRQRLWSERTGKIPDTPEIATLLFRKGGRWMAPELADDHDTLEVPYCIMVGDLDATGDESGKQPVVQCFMAHAEVNKDQRHTLIQI